MTLAHSGSRLSLKNMTPVLPEGMILFPLDGRVQDTRNEIPVLLNTTTVRDDEKKFFASIAVEDATTNLIANPMVPNYVDWYSQGIQISSYIDTDGYTVKKYWKPDGSGFNAIWNNATSIIDSNSLHCYSVYARGKGSARGIVHQANLDNSDTQQSVVGNFVTLDHCVWKRLTVERYYIADGVSQHNILIELSAGTGNYIEVKMPQLEKKDYVTSFVNGSRGSGNLKYDISSLGMRDAGCVACWIYNSDSMVHNRATGGVVSNQYLIKLGSYKYNDPYDDAMTLWIQNTTPRQFRFWSSSTTAVGSHSSDHITSLSTVDQYGGVGAWNHFVIQWDKNGLPSGNKKEFYINGVLQGGNTTTTLPNNILTYLHLGSWTDNDDGLKPSTMFEQLAIHPSKGFAPEVIENWYIAQAPFFDVKDQLFFY